MSVDLSSIPTYVAGWHDAAAVSKMPYRKLGSRLVSQLTFGASAFGGAFGNPGGVEDAKAILHKAVRSGINLIDVAPWYGHGKAESVLGEALKGIPREAYYLTTKCVTAPPPRTVHTHQQQPPPTFRLVLSAGCMSSTASIV